MSSIVLQDLKYGIRLLGRAPGFTAAAVLSLALGIGANTTIFTLVNAVLLNPLPVEDPSRLISLFTTDDRNAGPFGAFAPTSDLNFKDYRERNVVFADLAAHAGVGVSVTGGGGNPEQIFGEIVTGNYFSVLGARPLLGRGFLPDEDQTAGSKLVTVLSYNLWQTRFGGDRSMVGQTVTLNNQAFTVVGVMPQGFKGTNTIGAPALWVPYMTYPVTTAGFFRAGINTRRTLLFNVTGRLKPGTTLAAAESNLRAIGSQLASEFPAENQGRSVSLVPLARATINPAFRNNIVVAGGLLMTIVGLVLLIACANVANLLLARAAVRQKEIAVRLSLGASRSRLIRQLLTESLLLAVTGGALGLLFAYWAEDVLWSFRPPFLQDGAIDLALDLRVLSFTAGIAVLTGVLFGLAPAVQSSRPDLANGLKERTSVPTGTSSLWSVRNVLVCVQMALSLVALVGAGLFLRSLQNAQRIEPGFDAEQLAVLTFNLGAQGYTEPRGREFQRVALERASSIAGVESATLANNIPLLQGGFLRSIFLEGQDTSDRSNGRLVQINIVGDRYFETAGIPLVRGRMFETADQPSTPAVVIINETMAERFWPDGDAIGKRFKFFGQDNFQQVVGIAKDSKYNFIGEDATPFIYQPFSQVYQPVMSLFVKAANPEAVIGLLRAEIQQLDRNLPLTNVFTLMTVFAQGLWAPRMGASLLAIFAVLSLTLAVIGVYGVMAYSVTQRTREIGIRMALGASRREVLRLVVSQGLRLTAIGVVVGLAVSFALARLVATLLFGVGSADAVTFISVSLVLAVAALGATYLPARRATKIDPMVALRYE
jgi:predicted permease